MTQVQYARVEALAAHLETVDPCRFSIHEAVWDEDWPDGRSTGDILGHAVDVFPDLLCRWHLRRYSRIFGVRRRSAKLPRRSKLSDIEGLTEDLLGFYSLCNEKLDGPWAFVENSPFEPAWYIVRHIEPIPWNAAQELRDAARDLLASQGGDFAQE